jgi:hypothetical protein
VSTEPPVLALFINATCLLLTRSVKIPSEFIV